MYRDGVGVAQNFTEAKRMLQVAAEQGIASAQRALGGMYSLGGDGFPADFSAAYAWYSIAAVQGDSEAAEAVTQLEAEGGRCDDACVDRGAATAATLLKRYSAPQKNDAAQAKTPTHATFPKSTIPVAESGVQKCESRDNSKPKLGEGLTYAYLTPLLRKQLNVDASVLSELRAHILAMHASFVRNYGNPEICSGEGETANDRFYWAQHDAVSTGKPPLVDVPTELVSRWMSEAKSYVAGTVGPESAAEYWKDHRPMLVWWASVHEACSSHPTHTHEGASISGTFYVDVPSTAGRIYFEDPRGSLPPFSRNRIDHQPSVGELLLFPPWLSHGVSPGSVSLQGSQSRIALSFNVVETSGAKASRRVQRTKTEWELLSSAKVVVGSSSE